MPHSATMSSVTFLADKEPYVDLITIYDGSGRPHSYARNATGLHVPIETLNERELRQAIRFKKQYL